MSCSEKQRLANSANAQKSTGPTSEAGKMASRANALKHGLAARVLASSVEDQDDIDQLSDSWIQELAPQGGLAGCHAERAFRAYIRLSRCDYADDEALATRVRNAFTDWDIRRGEKVRSASEELESHPWLALAKLRSTAEGCRWLVAAWEQLEYRLHSNLWTIEESLRASVLQGLGESIDNPWLESNRSFESVGELKGILAENGLTLDSSQEQLALLDAQIAEAAVQGRNLLEMTRLDLATQIQGEVARYQALAEELQPESNLARDRSERIALFDDSPEGLLRHRYQREAERELHRNLSQARQLSKNAPRSESARPVAVKPPSAVPAPSTTPPAPRSEPKPAAKPALNEPISMPVVSLMVDLSTVAIQAELQAIGQRNAQNGSKPRPKVAV